MKIPPPHKHRCKRHPFRAKSRQAMATAGSRQKAIHLKTPPWEKEQPDAEKSTNPDRG